MPHFPNLRISWKDQTAALLGGLGHGAVHWMMATFYLILPFAAHELGLSYAQVGVLVATLHISSVAANLGSGPVVDVTGRRALFMALSLVIGAAAFVAFQIVENYLVFLLLVPLIGASNNLWHPAAISCLADHYPTRKGFALSIHAMGASIAESVAPLAAGALLAAFSWRTTASLGALPAVAVTIAIAALLMPGETPTQGGSRQTLNFAAYFRGLRAILTDRSVWNLSVMSGFRAITMHGLFVFVPLYMADRLGVSPMLMGIAMAAYQIGGLVGTGIIGTASDRLGPRPVMRAGFLIAALITVLITLSGDTIPFIAGVSALGLILFGARPVIQSWLMDMVPPSMGGSAISVLFGIQAGFSGLSQIAAGMIADRWGLDAVFYLLAGVMVIAHLLAWRLPDRQPAKAAEPTVITN